MGICGSCAMIVNNKPVLACHTQIKRNFESGYTGVDNTNGA